MATTRSENIRELERALIGLDSEPGVKQHIQRVLKTYEDTIKAILAGQELSIANTPQEIPDSYLMISGALLLALDGIDAVEQQIKIALQSM